MEEMANVCNNWPVSETVYILRGFEKLFIENPIPVS